MKEYIQTGFVIWINQFIFLIGLIYFWNYAYIVIPAMYVIGFFWEASLHKYFAHKSYSTGYMRNKLLLGMSFVVGQGSILSWSNVHRHHHRWADTERDPHSPFFVSWWRICSSNFPNKCQENYVRNLIKTSDKNYLLFENKNYLYMWILFWCTLFLIDPLLLFFIVGGSALWWWAVVFVNIFSHSKLLGNSPEEKAIGTNSMVINSITGIGYHYNHHKDSTQYTDRTDNETSIYGALIKFLFVQKTNCG